MSICTPATRPLHGLMTTLLQHGVLKQIVTSYTDEYEMETSRIGHHL